jgi:hypothetical protein
VGSEDLAISKFNYSPSIIIVTILGELAINGMLAYSNNSVNLFLRVNQAGLDIEKVSSDVDL